MKTRSQSKNHSTAKDEQPQGLDKSQAASTSKVQVKNPDTDTVSMTRIKKQQVKQVDNVRKQKIDRSKTRLQSQDVSNEQKKPVLRQLRSRKDISTLSKTDVLSTDGLDDKIVKYMKSCEVSLERLDIEKYNAPHVPIYKTVLPLTNDKGNNYEFVADNEPAVQVKKTRTGFKIKKKQTKTAIPNKKQKKVSKNVNKKLNPQMPEVTTERRNPTCAEENIIIPDNNTGQKTITVQQKNIVKDKRKNKENEISAKSDIQVPFNEQALPGQDEDSDHDFDLGEIELEVDVRAEQIPENNNNKEKEISLPNISKEQTPQIEVTPVASSYNRNKIAARSLTYSTFTSPIMAQPFTTHISTPMRVDIVESPRIPANFPVKQHSYLPAYMREVTHFHKDYGTLGSQLNNALPSVSNKETNSTQTTLTKYKINSNVSGLYQDPRVDPKKTRLANKPGSINILDSFNKINKSLSETLNTPDEVEISNYNVDNYFGFETSENNLFPIINKKSTITRVITQKPTRVSLTEMKNVNSNIKKKHTKKRSYGKENVTNLIKKSQKKKNDSLFPQKVIENSSPVKTNTDSVEVSRAPIVNIEESASVAVENETATPLLSIALFEDVDGDEDIVHHKKINRRSYERPLYAKRNRSMNESLDLELMPEAEDITKKVYPKKKKAKNKMTKKEEAAYEEWARNFNSMCEDVEANPILIE